VHFAVGYIVPLLRVVRGALSGLSQRDIKKVGLVQRHVQA